MRSTLLPALCLASLVGTAAHAQETQVTVYGRLNVDIELVSGRISDTENPHVFRVNSNSSQFGIRGRESLGRDVTGIFQLESAVPMDTGGGTLARRDTFVGLESARWGTLRLGNFLSPYDDIHVIFGNAPTFTTSILSTAALWSQGALPKATGGFDEPLPNAVRWDSPNISGFNGSVQYSTRESENHAHVATLGAFYSRGSGQIGIAYERNSQVRGPGINDSAFSVAALYTFALADIGGVYERLSYDTPTGTLTRDFLGLGATVSVGPGVVYAFVGRAGDGKGSAAQGTRVGGLARGADTASTQYEISYSYSLSKRTIWYAGYTRLQNQSNASYTFAINPYPPAIGGKPEGVIVGLVHFF